LAYLQHRLLAQTCEFRIVAVNSGLTVAVPQFQGRWLTLESSQLVRLLHGHGLAYTTIDDGEIYTGNAKSSTEERWEKKEKNKKIQASSDSRAEWSSSVEREQPQNVAGGLQELKRRGWT
jgi:hypothetical protein